MKRKTMIVTGASQGIGAGVAKEFIKRGYNVVANSRKISKSEFTPTDQLVLVDGNIGEAATAAKIAEASMDYSVQNTAREALFLQTDREAKYKGKAAIDSFFWRAGDALAGLVVFAGTRMAFGTRTFGAWRLLPSANTPGVS